MRKPTHSSLGWAVTGTVLITMLGAPVLAVAQDAPTTGAATGTVFDLRTGAPIANASVRVDGTKLEAKTGKDGTFRIEQIPPGERVFRLEAGGYATVIEKAMIDPGWTSGFEVGMAPMVAMLEALSVEVGLGSAIGDSLTESSRILHPDEDDNPFQSLSRVPGVHVSWPGGGVGRGARIQIRGLSSMMMSNNPAFYLDGVRIGIAPPVFDNSGTGSVYYSLDFLDPRTIDRIEVLRGPATAFRYGGDAASGIIMIYTKHGGG